MYTVSKYYTILPKRSENLRISIIVCGRIIQNQSCVDNNYGSLIIQFILFSLQMEDLKNAVYTVSTPVLDFTFLQTKRQYLRLRKVQF